MSVSYDLKEISVDLDRGRGEFDVMIGYNSFGRQYVSVPLVDFLRALSKDFRLQAIYEEKSEKQKGRQNE